MDRVELGDRQRRTLFGATAVERFGRRLLAMSFVILALMGLNVLYGRYVLLPQIGADAFAWVSQSGTWLQGYVAFAFVVGLALTCTAWMRRALMRPGREDNG